MTTVALYARVSSRKQAQEGTIASQVAELERKIAADGHELLDEYRFKDDGRSGSNLERDGLKALLSKVAEGKINKIYIHALDRLSRDGRDQRDVIDECKRAQAEIISLDCNTNIRYWEDKWNKLQICLNLSIIGTKNSFSFVLLPVKFGIRLIILHHPIC